MSNNAKNSYVESNCCYLTIMGTKRINSSLLLTENYAILVQRVRLKLPALMTSCHGELSLSRHVPSRCCHTREPPLPRRSRAEWPSQPAHIRPMPARRVGPHPHPRELQLVPTQLTPPSPTPSRPSKSRYLAGASGATPR